MYWEPHCDDIPICWAIRSVFDTLDGFDSETEDVLAWKASSHRMVARSVSSIPHETDPISADGIKRVDAIKDAVFEAIRGTPLEGSRVYLGGIASVFKDLEEGNNYDLMIAGVAALTLIFIIMLLITRSLFAAGVIVVLSLGASFGVSVLVWQHLLGMELQFMVMAMAVIILLAVGADYNLLLVARMNEEIPAGINTGTIRAMDGSGSVVTAVAQIGTTIGWGLLLDTLVIRAFMTPSIAALVGRWFW